MNGSKWAFDEPRPCTRGEACEAGPDPQPADNFAPRYAKRSGGLPGVQRRQSWCRACERTHRRSKTYERNRMTLAIGKQLHAEVTAAAQREGVSIVAWATKVLGLAAKGRVYTFCAERHCKALVPVGVNRRCGTCRQPRARSVA